MIKGQIRRQMLAARCKLTAQEAAQAGKAVARHLATLTEYRQARWIYCYIGYNQELPTEDILRLAQTDGKKIAVPKVLGKALIFVVLEDLGQIQPGYRGIPEPLADGPIASDSQGLVLVPGLAFDGQGHRVGYGGGFYDRFLHREPAHPTIGLCYAFQLIPQVPFTPYDIAVKKVITPERIIAPWTSPPSSPNSSSCF